MNQRYFSKLPSTRWDFIEYEAMKKTVIVFWKDETTTSLPGVSRSHWICLGQEPSKLYYLRRFIPGARTALETGGGP